LQHRPPIISAATLASAPELDLEDSGSELDDYDAAYEAAWQENEPRPGHESEVSNSDKDEPEATELRQQTVWQEQQQQQHATGRRWRTEQAKLNYGHKTRCELVAMQPMHPG
jgi:hypothetical protein